MSFFHTSIDQGSHSTQNTWNKYFFRHKKMCAQFGDMQWSKDIIEIMKISVYLYIKAAILMYAPLQVCFFVHMYVPSKLIYVGYLNSISLISQHWDILLYIFLHTQRSQAFNKDPLHLVCVTDIPHLMRPVSIKYWRNLCMVTVCCVYLFIGHF